MTKGSASVLAAGVLCWRRTRDGGPQSLEVLLVHRPRYDDWSWPKGKRHPGELLPVCALRELAEETGGTGVLGRPLPTVEYTLPDGRLKQVSYWAVHWVSPSGQKSVERVAGDEVDVLTWVPIAQAGRRLSRPSDGVPLRALADFAGTGELKTVPTLIVRHAAARPRDSWTRADADRPLVAAGQRQALGMTSLLQCWKPEEVLSSPWRRCLDTVGPYLTVSGAKLRTKTGLSEDGHRRHRAKARRHADALLHTDRPTALCTHRPVLEAALAALWPAATPQVRACLPSENPFLAAGEVLVAHVVHGEGRRVRVVAVERHLAPT